MNVHFKFGSVVKVVTNVTIDENCGPVVDGKRIHESPREAESTISWFKSLLMEAVYIDCGLKDARWCPKSVTIKECTSGRISPQLPVPLGEKTDRPAAKEEEELPFMPESARPLFSEQPGVLDFNPIIDEMFERTEKLLHRWDVMSQNGEINKEIAKILHCHVFPAVSFQHADIPALQECLQIIVLRQKGIEREIVKAEKDIEVTDNFLNQQKNVLIARGLMTTQSYLQACDGDFVDMFYTHVIKDLKNKNMTLEILQMKINELKRKGQDAEELGKLKKDRDALKEIIDELLNVREAIRDHRYRPFIPKKKKREQKFKRDKEEASLHTMFKKVYQTLVEEKEVLERLYYRKLLTVSVREAIESIVKKLQQNRPGTLGDVSEFSLHSSVNEANEKQWKSMQARVDAWMSSHSSLYHVHMKGCQRIKDLADGMLSDSRIASIDFDPSEVETAAAGTGQDVLGKRAPMVQAIKHRVISHTWNMANEIVKQMNFDASLDIRHLIDRAWMCYEPHFWKEAGKMVESVYTHYHAQQARKVHRLVPSMVTADIMDRNFFQQLCFREESRGCHSAEDFPSELAADARSRSFDTLSAASLDLRRCSMTDLYARANRDGAELKLQMLELESDKFSVTYLGSSSSSDSNDLCKANLSNEAVGTDISEVSQLHRESKSASDSSARVHFNGLFDTDKPCPERENIWDSQTVAPVLSLSDSVVEPYHAKVQEVLNASSIVDKMRAVRQSVDFLSKKMEEICKARGMDNLLPMSIFATAGLSEDLFVKYYIQLLILIDLEPPFALHSVYDFSLISALSAYMFFFADRFPGRVQSDESIA